MPPLQLEGPVHPTYSFNSCVSFLGVNQLPHTAGHCIVKLRMSAAVLPMCTPTAVLPCAHRQLYFPRVHTDSCTSHVHTDSCTSPVCIPTAVLPMCTPTAVLPPACTLTAVLPVCAHWELYLHTHSQYAVMSEEQGVDCFRCELPWHPSTMISNQLRET
jgi:hypothetical protein